MLRKAGLRGLVVLAFTLLGGCCYSHTLFQAAMRPTRRPSS